MGDVVVLNIDHCTLPIPCERVISAALRANLKEVVIAGWAEDGTFYFAMSETNAANIGHVLDLAKATLIRNQLAQE